MADDKVEQLWDIHEIQQIYLTYAMSMDSHRWSLMESCFLPDARIELSPLAREVAGVEVVDLASWQRICEQTDATFDVIQHYLYQPLIQLEGDRAFTRVYFVAQHVLNALAPDAFFTLGGWYDGEVSRHGGRWLISRHKLVETWRSGNPRVVLGSGIPIGAAARGTEHGIPAWVQ